MPLLKARHDHVKVFRPSGTPYAESVPMPTAQEAVRSALSRFIVEFDRVPCGEPTVIEVVGMHGQWTATVFELPDDHQAD